MSSVRQYESPWLDVSLKMVEVVIQVVSGDAVGAAASTLTPAVITALNTIVQTQAKQLEQLNQIATAIEAHTMEEPYRDGLNKLEDAARAPEEADRKDRITQAIESFDRARAAAQARVATTRNGRYLFRQAVAEYQIGNSRALLTQLDWARTWYQDAYATATQYLFAEESPVRPSWDIYKKYAGVQYNPRGIKEFVQSIDRTEIIELIDPEDRQRLTRGAIGVAGGTVATVSLLTALGVTTVALPFVLPAVAGSIPAAIKYLERKAKEKFTEEAAPALSLIDALRQLRTGAPDLDLKFHEPHIQFTTPQQNLEIQYRRAIEG